MECDYELPAREVIPAALAAGALTPGDVVHRGVLVEQVGRSHLVYRVSVGGVLQFFVKTFGPTRGATDGLAARERAVLALARDRPPVAALVPDAWAWERSPQPASKAWNVVVTKAMAGTEAWTVDRGGGGTRTTNEAWAALVQALAAPLAAFHRATRDLAKPGADLNPVLRALEPWGLCVMDGDAAPELWVNPATAALLHDAAADPALVAGIRGARGLWRSLALVHGDLKHDNVLLEPTADGFRARVLDWEMARIGDPAWDLAGLTARLAAARGDEGPWQGDDLAAAALLVRTYSEASGLRPSGLAQRQVLYAGTVLLMMALQHGSTLAPGADMTAARLLVMKARATFRSADRLVAQIVARSESIST